MVSILIMKTNTIAIIGDMHFGIKAGDNDFLDFQLFWLEDCLKKLHKMGITTVIQTGDFFDTRSHIKLNVLHAIMNKFPKLLEQYKIKKWIMYGGNHDMFYRDSNEICSLSIFHKLVSNYVEFIVYTNEVGFLNIENKKIAFVPWLNKNNSEELMTQLSNEKNVEYVFGHFELIGMPMIPGVLCENGIDPLSFKSFRRVISGHFHTVSTFLNCTMVGTPFHLTWGDVQDGTNRGFWTLDTETDELAIHKNEERMTLFSVIEYDDTEKYTEKFFEPYKGTIAKILIKEKSDAKNFKKFSELLSKVGFIDYKLIDSTMVVIDKVEISEETLSLDTLSAINAYIDGQGDGVNKTAIKGLAKTIYMRALNGEQ
jgi:DNA repair exonuclease SbcCD nuclease subunit